jgi:hypothetical protein
MAANKRGKRMLGIMEKKPHNKRTKLTRARRGENKILNKSNTNKRHNEK